ncbi:tetratricopeptide repeat protein [Acetobacter persici]|uniref:tetratricopeptide repeat protein n=1 Tax=Acetobacter persici TaxID=1076596 RepID=UPI001BAA2AE0|nr:sel1 repeat family protein [Acetobacter persici]MBS1016964.1 sel1 repeat family protein [Acetobacter persici]
MSNSIIATATPNGVTLSFPSNGTTPPPTVTLLIDRTTTFEGCAARMEGNRVLVHVTRDLSLSIDPGTEVEVSAAGLEGEVEWPELPKFSTGPDLIGATLGQTTHRPPPLKHSPVEALPTALPPKETQVASPPEPPVLPPTPIQPPVAQTRPAAPIPADQPPSRNNTKPNVLVIIGVIVGGLLFMILILALLWHFVLKKQNLGHLLPSLPGIHVPSVNHPAQEAHGPVPVAPINNTPAVASGVGGLETLAVPEVVLQASSPAAISAEGTRRLNNGKPDDGLRLLEAASDRGDTSAMENLAHMYDPATFKDGGPVPKADEEEAARYYRKAADAGDTQISQDRAKLQASLKQRADNGDTDAALTLESYFK